MIPTSQPRPISLATWTLVAVVAVLLLGIVGG